MADLAEHTIVDGRYRIVRRIGTGGMADVYCAEDTHLGRMVALKLLHLRFAQDQEFVERFRREASSAAGLQHPNVVGVYDRGRFDETYYIAMEYCEGSTLKEVIVREAPLDPRRAIQITKQVLVATRFAHRRNVIHRDLKPHNVIIDSEGNVKVTDFGIARAGASDITEVGAIMGTAQYLSPEQAQGRPVMEASDLYSIGIVLYEMLTGQAPFEGDSAVAIALKHVNQPVPSPRRLVPEIPPELEAVVVKALAKDPAHRYGDAESFLRDLDAVEARLEGGPVDTESTAVFAPVGVSPPTAVVAPPAPPVPPPAPPPDEPPLVRGEVVVPPVLPPPPPREPQRPRRWWAWLLAALALAGLVLIGFLLLRPNEATVPQVLSQTLESARQELEGAGFQVDVKRRTDPAPADTVIDQVPGAGTSADEGSTVTLIVSNGPSTVKVPDVVGLQRADARRRVREARLVPEVELESSTTVPAETVIRSDPGPGRLIERGSRVTLFVSEGPREVEVPSVIGANQEDAVARLRDAGLSPIVREKSSSEPVDTVVSQSPAPGLSIDEGSSVTIFVSNGKVTEVPDVTGLSQDDAESELQSAGFDVAVRTREVAAEEDDGLVLSQSPKAGAERTKGSTVTITVGTFTPPPAPEPTP